MQVELCVTCGQSFKMFVNIFEGTMNDIFVSVIIPVKNEAENIRKCLISIKSNNYLKMEIIVVDNGSTDSTVDVAREFGSNVFVKPELTISGLRNFGAKIAKGQFLAFVDSDCEVASEWIESALIHFADYNVGCVGSTAVAPDNGTWVQKVWGAFRARNQSVIEAGWLNSMNMFVRNNVFVEVGGFSEDLVTCEDVDLCYRIKNTYKVISDPKIKVIHNGEASTLRIFFNKEKWRGQSNFLGVFRHGIVIREIPSLMLPIFYILLSMMLVIGLLCFLVFKNITVMLMSIILFLIPTILFGIWACYVTNKVSYFGGYLILFNVYAMARMFSLVHPKSSTKHISENRSV
jgi:glycosyltransferase involved in cell wall biosynthesis